jgi:tetratricopeptide (TPR) repeat protein
MMSSSALPFQHLLFQTYCNIHSSLYSSLELEDVALLEQATWYRRLGEFDKAERILESNLAHLSAVPLVLMERAGLYFSQGKPGKMWSLLDPAVQWLRTSEADLATPEHRLLLLLHAQACLHHRGNINPAIAELQRTRLWLCDKHVDQYTDIEVRLSRRTVYEYRI